MRLKEILGTELPIIQAPMAGVQVVPNRFVREMGPLNAKAPEFPLATSFSAPLRAQAEAAGSGDFSPLWSGQNATGCRAAPAAEIVAALAAGLDGR